MHSHSTLEMRQHRLALLVQLLVAALLLASHSDWKPVHEPAVVVRSNDYQNRRRH
jgi:hypothetical protein